MASKNAVEWKSSSQIEVTTLKIEIIRGNFDKLIILVEFGAR